MMEQRSERRTLDRIAEGGAYETRLERTSALYAVDVFSRYWHGGSCLELGPAGGAMSGRLLEAFDRLTLVDGSQRFCTELEAAHPAATVVCSLFEDFSPVERFDAVVMGHVLEHVASPPLLLTRVRDWLEPGGAIFIAVPNARSIHRQAAVLMGLLQREDELNEPDCSYGHRRVYDPATLRAELLGAGHSITAFGGYWLKPLSNAQIEEAWSDEMLDAFMRLGEHYPEIAGEIYAVATP